VFLAVLAAFLAGPLTGGPGGLGGSPALAGNASLKEALGEKVMGERDAPVTIYEYSSLSCPHCKAFHKDTLPRIKKEFIDTGKVKLVYRDFPLGSLALAGSMLARCAGDARFFGMIEALFRSQKTWIRSDTPLDELQRIVRFGGLTPDDVETCLDNEALMKGIQARAKEDGAKYKINSTPTFVVEGKVIRGNLEFKDFREVIEKALAGK